LVADWLTDLADGPTQLNQLQIAGAKRLKKRTRFLANSIKHLSLQKRQAEQETELRVAKLIAAKSEKVKRAIETSIDKLANDQEETEAKKAYLEHEVSQINAIIADNQKLFSHYQRQIANYINSTQAKRKEWATQIFSRMLLGERELTVALSPINRKGDVSTLFVASPGRIQVANPRLLVADFKTNYLLYHGKRKKLTKKQLETAVKNAEKAAEPLGEPMKGQVPFGYASSRGRLIKDKAEQQTIRKMKQWHAKGASLREIANKLNEKIIPAKNSGYWQANTVKKILDRIAKSS